jgi:hypothetical protein
VQENFSGTGFPPPGWTIDNGSNCSWYLEGGYAEGHVSLPTGPSSGSGNFLSPVFTLCEGDTCLVDFLSRQFWEPYAPLSPSGGGWKISLRLDNLDIWYQYLQISGPWVPTSVEIPISTSSSNYRFCWRLYGMLGDYVSGRGIYIDVDDVLIRLTAVEVEPASLGRLKTLYR